MFHIILLVGCLSAEFHNVKCLTQIKSVKPNFTTTTTTLQRRVNQQNLGDNLLDVSPKPILMWGPKLGLPSLLYFRGPQLTFFYNLLDVGPKPSCMRGHQQSFRCWSKIVTHAGSPTAFWMFRFLFYWCWAGGGCIRYLQCVPFHIFAIGVVVIERKGGLCGLAGHPVVYRWQWEMLRVNRLEGSM